MSKPDQVFLYDDGERLKIFASVHLDNDSAQCLYPAREDGTQWGHSFSLSRYLDLRMSGQIRLMDAGAAERYVERRRAAA